MTQSDFNFKIQSDRILVKLFPLEESSAFEHIIVDKFKTVESDGGRQVSIIDSDPTGSYQTRGEVVQIGKFAETFIPTHYPDLKVGSIVLLAKHAISPTNQFFTDRTIAVQDFEGYLLLPINFVEAVEIDGVTKSN